MRRRLTLLVTIPMLAGCELDMFGPTDGGDWCFISCGGDWGGFSYPPPPPSVRVTGSVWVGDYQAMEGETRILLYAASDTVSPVDSIAVYGHYWRDFGPTPAPDVCEYLARAVLWSGESTPLEPLFAAADSCQASSSDVFGPTFRLPAYPPLAEPFVIRGRVLVQGAPAKPGEVQLRAWLRAPPSGDAAPVSTTDGDGGWSFEVNDGAQRYGLCRWVDVEVQYAGAGSGSRLNAPSSGICESERILPEVRIGTRKAAVVEVLREMAPGVLEGVVAGAATVSLRLPSDSSVVGEEFATLDDGTAHVWFPHSMTSPGCSFLLKVELGTRVQYHPLLYPGATTCSEGQHYSVRFIGT